jgi:hypothetical protein
MHFHHLNLAQVLLIGLAMLVGCGDLGAVDKQAAKRDSSANKSTAASHGHSHEHDCEHAEKGPHGGQVFELGGAYHAELVHDEKAHLIDIHILDSQARQPVAIEEPQIVVNAMVRGKPMTFELAAAPLKGDGEGRSSRFQSKDDVLFHSVVEDHDSKSRLRVNIEGKQYVADIAACEEHDEDHDHKDHGDEVH